MTREADLVRTDAGLLPETDGWFVVNLRDAAWWHHDTFGDTCSFEGARLFPHLGINVHVVWPGQPACMYHREDRQEDFLVLSGECLLIVEEQERGLSQWDLFHAAPGTDHVFVGAGSGPCVILMVGARHPEKQIVYPPSEVAARHGASVETETGDPREAYARFRRPTRSVAPPPFAG